MNWFEKLMTEIGTFITWCGGPAFRVSIDILGQVAEGGTTPVQVAATVADLKALTDAAKSAADACDKMDGTATHSVLSSLSTIVTAGSAVANQVADSGAINETAAKEVRQAAGLTEEVTAMLNAT